MKSTKNVLIAVVAGIALSLIANSATAQAAKGAELQRQLSGTASTATIVAPATSPMSCPKCIDVIVAASDAQAKGAAVLTSQGSPVKSVAEHLCPHCTTTIATSKAGKIPVNTVTHNCPGTCAKL